MSRSTPCATRCGRTGRTVREVDEKIERFAAQVRGVHRAAEFVILEGPLSVVEALYRVVHASDDLAEVVRRMVRDAHAGDTSRKVADTALADEREHLLYQAVKGLRAAAADVLGRVSKVDLDL
jgi:hypothetical protein